MKTEIEQIVNSMQDILSGNPWYGNSVLSLLNRVDTTKVYVKPGTHVHSMIELLYHMITWAEFTQKRLEKDQHMNGHATESLDWRQTDAEVHTWNHGIAQFTVITNKTIDILKASTDRLLEEQVDFRQYSFRFLLNGIIQHHIYHVAQIILVNKILH